MADSAPERSHSPFPRTLETERLQFSPLHETDPLVYYRFAREQPPEVWAYVPQSEPETPGEVRARFETECEAWRSGERAMYAVRDVSGALVGETMLAVQWDRRVAWLGLILCRDHWGRGYSGERAEAMLAVAFDRLDCEWVCVSHSEGNENSRRAIERYADPHGGRREALLRGWAGPGEPPEVCYAISREGWERDSRAERGERDRGEG